MKQLCEIGSGLKAWLTSRAVAALMAVALVLSGVGVASATDPLLPSTGVNVSTMIGEVVTQLGTIVGVIVAAYFAFLLIRKALRWAKIGF